ncbi:MAG: LPS export ABC transporter permease LptG [Desulfuromonadales bacterium]
MTILTRYILAYFRRIFLLALGAFIGLYMLVEFFDKIDNFVEHQATLAQYALYFTNFIPIVFVQIVPLAVLLGGFLTLGGLSRSQELTAMRSGGIGLWSVAAPIIFASVFISLLVVGINETVVPAAQQEVNQIYEVEVRGRSETLFKRNKIWFRDDDSIVNIRYFSPEKGRLEGVTIFSFSDDFHLMSRVDVPRALFEEGQWSFSNARERRFDPETGELTGIKKLPEDARLLDRTLEDLKIAQPQTEEMNFRELGNFVEKLQSEGYDPTRYLVDMHVRLARPFTNIIMALLAIPFALQRGRRSNLAMGVGFSLFIGIAFYILDATILAFGYSGVLPPFVAAWAANLLFLLIGIWMLLVVRY